MENVRPRGVWIKKLFARATRSAIFSKGSLTNFLALFELAHILWKATEPTIVLTDNKSATPFSQTEAILPALWNACDYVRPFNFEIADIAVSVNTAADSLSRLEFEVTEKVRLKIWEDIQTTPVEVATSPSDVADEE